MNSNESIVKILLDAGANPNLQDELKTTGLMWAVRKGSEPIVKLLLNAGANFHIKNKYDKTALDIAKREGHKEIVQLLNDWKSAISKIRIGPKKSHDHENHR